MVTNYFKATLFLFVFVCVEVRADFITAKKPTDAQLLEQGSWFCNSDGTEEKNIVAPTDAKGVAQFVQKHWGNFKFEKKSDGNYKNTGQTMHANLKFDESVGALMGVKDIGPIDMGNGKQMAEYNLYQLMRMDNGVLRSVLVSTDASPAFGGDKLPNFPIMKNGKVWQRYSCLSENSLKDTLIKSGCSPEKAASIIETADFLRNTIRKPLPENDKSCEGCTYAWMSNLAKVWNNSVSCSGDMSLSDKDFRKIMYTQPQKGVQ